MEQPVASGIRWSFRANHYSPSLDKLVEALTPSCIERERCRTENSSLLRSHITVGGRI